jgi:hypothetical protein
MLAEAACIQLFRHSYPSLILPKSAACCRDAQYYHIATVRVSQGFASSYAESPSNTLLAANAYRLPRLTLGCHTPTLRRKKA